jgi:hypothetical protein
MPKMKAAYSYKHLHLTTQLQRIISEQLILLAVTAIRTSNLFTGTTNMFVGRVGERNV